MLASMAWSTSFFYGLDNAFAYACFYDTSMGHYTWYLVPCNELSLRCSPSAFLSKPALDSVVCQKGIAVVYALLRYETVSGKREPINMNEKPLIVAYRNTGTQKRELRKH
jgi:hypothetical protein